MNLIYILGQYIFIFIWDEQTPGVNTEVRWIYIFLKIFDYSYEYESKVSGSYVHQK